MHFAKAPQPGKCRRIAAPSELAGAGKGMVVSDRRVGRALALQRPEAWAVARSVVVDRHAPLTIFLSVCVVLTKHGEVRCRAALAMRGLHKVRPPHMIHGNMTRHVSSHFVGASEKSGYNQIV